MWGTLHVTNQKVPIPININDYVKLLEFLLYLHNEPMLASVKVYQQSTWRGTKPDQMLI